LLLLTVEYNEPYYIGGLRQRLRLLSEKNEMQLRSTNDYQLDVAELLEELRRNKAKIAQANVRIDPRLKTNYPLANGPLTL
jgi:CRISPR-associated protein Csh2